MAQKKGSSNNKKVSKVKKIKFKNTMLIWLGAFVVIGVLVLFLGKLVLGSGSTDVDSDLTYPAVKSFPPIGHSVGEDVYGGNQPDPTPVEPTPIDYDAIPGLTNGKKYSKKLVDERSKNILFVGQDKVTGLYDTIGVLSIDRANEKLKVIMIPRDLYVDYNLKVRHYLELNDRVNDPDFYKINSAHFIGPYMKHNGKFGPYSMNFLAEVINEIFNIKIHDYVRVNTEGFVEIIDLFGGVRVNVPYDMNYDDIYQDLSIHIEQGWNDLDGKAAEGFVRYRQGNDEMGNITHSIGDYERKRNQLNLIKAFIEQHGTVGNINKLPGLLGTLNKNVKHSIGVGDILTSYIGYAKDAVINKYPIETVTVSGKDKRMNGRYYIVVGED